jgi:O-antigen ligase
MQVAQNSPNGPLSSGGKNALQSDIVREKKQLRMRYQRILFQRRFGLWWYRILILAIAAVSGYILLPSFQSSPIIIIGAFIGLGLLFVAARDTELCFFLVAFLATPFFPHGSVKSLAVSAWMPFLLLAFCVMGVQVAFRVRRPVLPAFKAMWPLYGLIAIAIISEVIVQYRWTPTVPHKINNNPIIYDELLGLLLFFIPIIIIIVTTVAVSKKERLIEYIQRMYLICALIAATLVIVEFKRIGGDVSAFRYTEPTIAWMSLRALSTLMVLGCIIAYARFLYATNWRRRAYYGVIIVMCIISVFLALQNSWWVELIVAIAVISIIYSRRWFCFLGLAVIPLTPLLIIELIKLQSVKSDDSLRFVIWRDALRVWSKQPLLGVGPGNFWAYDQRFTELSLALRNFNKTGLGVAHNGYLQALGEMGPIGLFFILASIVVIIVIASQLYHRSKSPEKHYRGFLGGIGLRLAYESEQRENRILGLICIGLVSGSAIADFFSGFFFLPPRQLGGFNDLSQVLSLWIFTGIVFYKDQLWRRACKGFLSEEEW